MGRQQSHTKNTDVIPCKLVGDRPGRGTEYDREFRVSPGPIVSVLAAYSYIADRRLICVRIWIEQRRRR